MRTQTINFVIISVLLCPYASAQWMQTNFPDNISVSCFAVSGTNLFAGTEVGVFLSTDNGTSWTALNSGLTAPRVYCLAFAPDGGGGTNLFAGGLGVFLSTNNGKSWAATGLKANAFALAVHPNGTSLFAGENGGVFLSTDNGISWSKTGLWSKVVTCLIFSPNVADSTHLFAGTAWSDGVWCLTNNDTNWYPVNSGLVTPKGYIPWVTSLALMGKNLFAGTLEGVFLSTNNGADWSAASTGLTTIYVNTLVVSGTNLFAGTGYRTEWETVGGGVFLSNDNGTSWIEVNKGLPNTPVIKSLAISTNETGGINLFAAADGGVWRRPLSEMISTVERLSDLPTNLILEQNYPNPFNPSTTIRFELPHSSWVSMKVYNVLGQEVTTLVDEEKPAGTYDLQFSVQNLSSGMYVYRMHAGDFTAAKQLIVLK